MSKNKAVIVISFGTSYKDTRGKTIEAIERDVAACFPDRKFYRAWTSGFIRKKILQRDGEKILSPEEALQLAAEESCSDLLILPTHLLAGGEYEKILEALKPLNGRFSHVHISRPLLENKEDIKEMAEILLKIFADVKADEAVAFMGHGSDCLKLPVYELLNKAFHDLGAENFAAGTVEFEPGIAPVLNMVRERKPKEVYLSPLLVVAGDHANNDMAGDEPDSWKNQLRAEGTEVECIVKGIGEYPEIRNLYINRAREALAAL
ncbi:MAG: sirohydrochlorin cobaltochelatase [Parasporobacterium sp.]|nr:sirohydrochlorin cobaltochelatase [Parasporobacterium sp.]